MVTYMIVLPVYIAYIVWNWAIARRGAAAASSFTLLVPIASGILSVLLYGENFDVAKVLGAGLVLVGLVLLQRRPPEMPTMHLREDVWPDAVPPG